MTSSTSPLIRPRLANLLAQEASVSAKSVRAQFGRRLGDLIDLSSSVALAEDLAQLAQPLDEYAEPAPEQARKEFLRVRAAMLATVMRSLGSARGLSRLRWPVAKEGEMPAAEAYGRFYAAHQADMDARVRGLQERVRGQLCGLSAQMAALTRLDRALGAALLIQSRQLLARIPRRVSARAAELLPGTDGELELAREIQALLLAEVDARLLPVQGLIEALEEITETNESISSPDNREL